MIKKSKWPGSVEFESLRTHIMELFLFLHFRSKKGIKEFNAKRGEHGLLWVAHFGSGVHH